MAQKLQQAMVALSEDNRDMKTAMRMMLKYEVQGLLDRLQDLGEDSLLLLANGSEGTSTHLGSPAGNQFITNCQSMCQLNLRESFLQQCSSSTGTSGNSSHGNMQPEGLLGTSPQSFVGGMTDMKFKGKQLGFEGNRSHPYNQFYNASAGQPGNDMNNQPGGPGWRNLAKKTRNYTNEEVDIIVAVNRKMCVNFLRKGQCHKGNFCGFVHTQDAQYIESMLKSGLRANGDADSFPQMEQMEVNTNRNVKTKVCRHFARGHCWMENSCSFLHVRDAEPTEANDNADRSHKESAAT